METLITNRLDIRIEGVTYSAKTWGNPNSKKRILALHGWLDNANTFDRIAPELCTNQYIVAVDLAGHGLSDHRAANADYYIWDYAIDILNCLDVLQWKTCTLIAHSLGTGVASIVAGAFPNRIEKLIFIDGLGAPFITNEDKIVVEFKAAYQQLKMAKKTGLYGFSKDHVISFASKEHAIQERIKNKISPISYAAASHLINRGLRTIPGGYRWAHDPRVVLPECYKMTEKQVYHFMKNITSDTLVILGEQGLFSKGLYHSRLDALKNAKICWTPGNHHLHLEDTFRSVATLIHDFL